MIRPSAVEIARALGRPDPTPEQVAVIEAPLAPLLVVAGAGSGKTETMAARVVWLVAGQDVAPDEVLGLTFTRKAAGELAERIRSRLRALRRSGMWKPAQSAELEVDVATYHSYAGRLVREHGMRLGLEPEARLLTEASCWQLAGEIVERWAGDMDRVEFAQSTVVNAVLALAAEAAEHLVDLEDVDAYLEQRVKAIEALPYSDTKAAGQFAPVRDLVTRLGARRQILPLVRAYQQAKIERECLDFGDQLAVAAALSQRFVQLGMAARSQYRAVLLDEFQDTSHAQLVMLESLFGGGHPVTAVGDPHQSIYGWRGASADTLARFAERFPSADGRPATVRHLTTSWRNGQAVLAVANQVAEPLRASTSVEVRDLRARDRAGRGEVEVRCRPTAADEADDVVDWIAQRWLDQDGRPASGRTAAVLCRRRSQFTDVEAALLRRGLPYEVVGIGGLLSTPEVADLLSALHVVHDPTRGDMLMRLLTGATCRLGAHDLTVLGGWARELHRRRSQQPGDASSEVAAERDVVDEASLVEALDELPAPSWCDRDGRTLSAPARARLERLSSTMRDLRGRTALALADLVVEVERALLLDVELASRPGIAPAQSRAHLDAIARVASGFEATADRATLGAFLAWLAAADEQEHGLEPGQVEVNEHAVQVMTVHAAKGLEWDVVAVPGMVEGGFPQHRSTPTVGDCGWVLPEVSDKGWLGDLGHLPAALRGDRAGLPDVRWSAAADQQALKAELQDYYAASGRHEMAEERRLAYVACTRARASLLLSSHVWGAGVRPRMPSRFLLELVPGLIDGVDARLSGIDAPSPELSEWLSVASTARWPEDGETKPDDDRLRPVTWPVDPLGERRAAVDQAAVRVLQAMQQNESRPSAYRGEPAGEPAGGVAGPLTGGVAGELAGIVGDVELLLAERDRAQDGVIEVALPSHVSASRLVRLGADPRSLALELRRPMPREPRPSTRRGTAFHAWVEQYLSAAALVDVLDLPGSADETVEADPDLEVLQQSFLRSEWARRRAIAVEVPLETPVDGTVVRGRVDAVFARDDGGVDIVDWKTGRPPTGRAAPQQAVQLAAYRLAWHRLHGLPLERIGAAFFYVATGETVRPDDLLDERGLIALLAQLDG